MSTSPTIYDQYRNIPMSPLPPPPTGMAGPGGPPSLPAPSMPKVSVAGPMEQRFDAIQSTAHPSTPQLAPVHIAGPNAAPELGTPQMAGVEKPAPGQLPYDQEQRGKIMAAGPGEEQLYHKVTNSQFGENHPILGKILGGLAAGATGAADIGLDTLGGGMGRLAAEQIPDTILNHQVELGRANRAVAEDEANNQKEALTGEENAQAANAESETNLREHPRTEYKPTDTVSGIMGYDPASNTFAAPATPNGQPEEPYTKPGPMQHVVIAGSDGKPQFATYQDRKYYDASGQEIPNAQPYEKPGTVRAVTLNVPGKGRVAGKADAQGNLLLESGQAAPEGSTIYQQPQQPSYASVLPMLTAGRAIDAATTKWQQESGAYQGVLNTLAEAKTGSELSASLVPLGLALVTPTAAGVHRINTAEIAQAGSGIGSVARRLDAALEKAGSGAIPPDTIREAEQFVRMYQKLKYREYVAQAHQAADTFKMPADHAFVTSMDGQQEMPLSSALQQQQAEDANGGGGSKSEPLYKMGDKTYRYKGSGPKNQMSSYEEVKPQ